MASIYLAPIIFRIIYSNFTAADIFLECRLSRKVYSWLLVSKEGEIFIKDVIARDLDLPHTKLEISTI